MIDEQIDATPAAPHAEWASVEIERRRCQAYADPITGSDRHFAEANRLSAAGLQAEADQARQVGLARFQEIQASHPYPEVQA